MKPAAERILADALALPDDQRAELIDRLIESIDPGADDESAAAWEAELARRIADLDAGRAKAVPWPQVRDKLRGITRGGQ